MYEKLSHFTTFRTVHDIYIYIYIVKSFAKFRKIRRILVIFSENTRILTRFRRVFIESRLISANSGRTLAESNRATAETVKFHVISCRYGADLSDSPRFHLFFPEIHPRRRAKCSFRLHYPPFLDFILKIIYNIYRK